MKRTTLRFTSAFVLLLLSTSCVTNSSIDSDGLYYSEESDSEENVVLLRFPISKSSSVKEVKRLFQDRAVSICAHDSVVVRAISMNTNKHRGLVEVGVNLLPATSESYYAQGSFFCGADDAQIAWFNNAEQRILAEQQRLGVSALNYKQSCKLMLSEPKSFYKKRWFTLLEDKCKSYLNSEG